MGVVRLIAALLVLAASALARPVPGVAGEALGRLPHSPFPTPRSGLNASRALFALDTAGFATADALLAAGLANDDACWRLPLPEAYREYLKSDIADLNNAPSNGFAGASVAGLFLDRFVPEGIDWAHFDTFAWRPVAKPARPKGGDALGLRAAWAMLQARYGG